MKAKFNEITIMNALLCLCVIMVHVTSAPVSQFTYGTFWHTLFFSVNKLLCFSVPAFIFLSGFKLHNKYKDTKIDLKSFYIGRLKTIVIPYIISVLVYFLYYYSKQWVLLSSLPEYIFLGTLAAHFYYIVIAVQFYLLFPLIKLLFDKLPKTFLVVSLICTVLCLEIFQFAYTDRFFGTYIFYFLLGMIFSKYEMNKKSKIFYIICGVVFVLLAAVHQHSLYAFVYKGVPYRCVNIINTLYVTFAIMTIYGICLTAGKISPILSCSKSLGKVSYNVYLYHILVMALLQYDIPMYYKLSPKWQFAISFIIVYGLTFIYAFVNKIYTKKRKSD